MKRLFYILAGALAIAAASPGFADARPVPAEQAYLSALAAHGFSEPNAGRPEDLARAVRDADAILIAGDSARAAAQLYGVVEGVRYAQLADSDAFENAEYLLGVALMRGGATTTARRYLDRVAARAGTLYADPALRKLVDLALARRDYGAQVSALSALGIHPTGAAAEEIHYLRGRAAYAERQDAVAESELAKVSPRCRFYSSATYLRGVMAARRGNFNAAEDAFCSIADESSGDPLRFVIDRRYFTVRDLARLALGRIAHEQGRFDDALYHYFVIPSDSEELPHALFESAWSMLERRRLDLAGRLVDALLRQFPDSPLRPEGELLRATIDVKSCRFASAAREFQSFLASYRPIEQEVARAERDAAARRALAARLLSRTTGEGTPEARMSKLLELDPSFYRLRALGQGLDDAAGDAAAVEASWAAVERRLDTTHVAPVAETHALADAASLLSRTRALGEGIASAHEKALKMERTNQPDLRKRAMAELGVLSVLEARRARLVAALARAAVPTAPTPVERGSTAVTMARRDQATAVRLRARAAALSARFDAAQGRLLQAALATLDVRLQAMLRHAQLGQIDAVVGSKKVLEKQIEDLAAGRFPPSMQGRLSLDRLIGDDEEYWPFEGEHWADEYQGYR